MRLNQKHLYDAPELSMSCEIELKLITGIPDSAKIKTVDMPSGELSMTVRTPDFEEGDA